MGSTGMIAAGQGMTRISELAGIVQTHTQGIDAYLQTNQLPTPSFHEDGPKDLRLSPDMESARVAALEACMELQDLLNRPSDLLRPVLNPTSLEAIYKFDIANKVPIHGEISYEELAKACDIYEHDLRRIIRFAICFHRLFREPRIGIVCHSTASRMIVDDPKVRDGMGLMFEDSTHSMARTVEAMQKFKSQEPAETGYSLAHNTNGKSAFEHMEDHPEIARRFGGAMTSFANYRGNSPEYLVKGYPWGSIGNGHGTIVDVGGSEGFYSIALAKSFPDLKFVVQDLPAVIKGVVDKRHVPVEVTDQISFMAHDVFTAQPVSADCYLFRWIFHDWPDSYVVKILRNLIPALKPGARVIVSDAILPEANTLGLMAEKKVRAVDMVMLSFFNSREREKGDWHHIFHEVDPRFKFVDAWTPKGAALGIIEAVWEG